MSCTDCFILADSSATKNMFIIFSSRKSDYIYLISPVLSCPAHPCISLLDWTRQQNTSPHLPMHSQNLFQWSASVFKLIWWPFHGFIKAFRHWAFYIFSSFLLKKHWNFKKFFNVVEFGFCKESLLTNIFRNKVALVYQMSLGKNVIKHNSPALARVDGTVKSLLKLNKKMVGYNWTYLQLIILFFGLEQ